MATDKPKTALKPAPPLQGRWRLTEDVRPMWLWLLGGFGITSIIGAGVADVAFGVDNLLPSIALEVGAGALLFALLFLLERRIVRRTSLLWRSGVEEWAAQSGVDPQALISHFTGPVAAALEFVEAILRDGDYEAAWSFADENWRMCRAQAWLWNNRSHPVVAAYDLDETAAAFVVDRPDHELWSDFAEIELAQFSETWSHIDLDHYGPASATREVDAGQIVLFVDIQDYPTGAVADEPTLVEGLPLLVRKIDGDWRVANHVGDVLPAPGWPPNWREGWTYWQGKLDELQG